LEYRVLYPWQPSLLTLDFYLSAFWLLYFTKIN